MIILSADDGLEITVLKNYRKIILYYFFSLSDRHKKRVIHQNVQYDGILLYSFFR